MTSTFLMARFSVAEAVLSFLGAGIAGTLWWADRNKVDLPCTASGGCEVVAQSVWSHLTFGPWHAIPVALLGFIAYLALLTLSMAKLGSESAGTRRLLQRLIWLGSALGFAYSWYLQYIAHFKIGAFCVWCFSSALTMTVLFAIASWEARSVRLMSTRTSPVKEHPTSHV